MGICLLGTFEFENRAGASGSTCLVVGAQASCGKLLSNTTFLPSTFPFWTICSPSMMESLNLTSEHREGAWDCDNVALSARRSRLMPWCKKNSNPAMA